MSTVLEPQMAKSKGRPRRSNRDDVTTKVDRGLMAKAKVIAAHRKMPLAELVSELLKAPIDRAYAQLIKEIKDEND